MRIYALMDEFRKEHHSHIGELRQEVKGYRADLNGRLRALETAEAMRTGVDHGKGAIGRVIVSAASVGAAVATVVTLLIKFA